MPKVRFIKENIEVEVPQGANLRTEANRAGINLHQGLNGFGASINRFANCHGMGMCGTCRVLIKQGAENINPPTMREMIKFKTPVPTPFPDPLPNFAYVQYGEELRLACQVRVNGDIEVESGPELDLFGENFFS